VRNILLAVVVLSSASALAALPRQDEMALRDSSQARIRVREAEDRRTWQALQQDRDEDTLELVGRWPWAGTYRARPGCNFANDSLVYVSSGSGIRILSAANPRRPRMVGQVNCHGSLYLTEFETKDTLLYVVYSYSMGLEVFSVADPSSPYELGRLELNGDVTGLGLKDSYAFVVGWDSLFRVIDVSNPRQPRQVRTLALPLDGLSVDVKGNYAYVGGSFAGLVAVDVTDPLNPQPRGQVGGFDAMSVVCDTAQPYIYVASREDGLQVVSIANPGSPTRAGSLATGDAWDVFKADTFVYLVGVVAPYQSDLFVASVANPTQPRLIGQSRGDGWTYGVCVPDPFGYAYTCDGWEGIHVRSLANPGNPVVDTAMYAAWTARDLAAQDSIVFCASDKAGLRVISVTDPSNPCEIGSYDTTNILDRVWAVAAADSFAYLSWWNMQSGFRSVDVSDPTRPRLAGTAPYSGEGQAIIIRDTLAFVAEDYFFEVYSIARPRQPVRIGRCDLTATAWGLWLQDTLAYVEPSLNVIDISDPSNPLLLSASNSNGGGVVVTDTFAYCVAWESLEVFSVADPRRPRKLAAVPFSGGCSADLQGSVLYAGGYRLEVFDITARTNPIRIAVYETPYGVRRIRHDSSLVYAACADGGLCIFRTCSTGVEEQPHEVVRGTAGGPTPTVARGAVRVGDGGGWVELYNITGKKAAELKSGVNDVSRVPAGVYFVRTDSGPVKKLITQR